jgi:hypothetical protein
VDNIKIGLGDIECSGVNWIGVAKDRNKWIVLVDSVMNLWVP